MDTPIVHETTSKSQPAMNDNSFHESLTFLKLHLDKMNKRSEAFRSKHEKLPATTPAEVNSSPFPTSAISSPSLQIPNGPAFWQLYRSLQSDIRGLDARVELMEQRFAELSDRFDRLEPCILTPPQSPIMEKKNVSSSHTVSQSTLPKAVELKYTPPASAGVKLAPLLPLPPMILDATTYEVGILTPTGLCSNNGLDGHMRVDSLTVFFARLKRAARTKRIVNFDQFLNGPALQLYRAGYTSDGKNKYDLPDDTLNIEAFEKAIVASNKERRAVPPVRFSSLYQNSLYLD